MKRRRTYKNVKEDLTSFQDDLKSFKKKKNDSSKKSTCVEQSELKSEETDIMVENNISEIILTIPYKNKEIPAVISYSESEMSNKCWIILTHGAGGDLNTPQLKAIASFLVAKEFTVVRFTCKGLNIKYRINVFCEVLGFLHKKYNPKRFFIGGRSMGARAAVMLLSTGNCITDVLHKIMGVICLSYPLHKVNDTHELRDGPLFVLNKPVFFLSGDNDEMCQKQTFEKVLRSIKTPYKVHWLIRYDHSAKSNSNYQEDVYLKAFCEISNWCQEIQEA